MGMRIVRHASCGVRSMPVLEDSGVGSTASCGVPTVRISAWFGLGFWFLYQLFDANLGLVGASAHGGGVAFFAHVGGFVFGVLVARFLIGNGRIRVTPTGPSAVRVPA
jgi:membrane associated rhomboid family serine protease